MFNIIQSNILSLALALFCLRETAHGLRSIENGLAAPEIVISPMEAIFEPKCEVTGNALDLVFVLDSSGSLKEQFQDEIDVIKRILDIVAIGKGATRAALVQFSGIQRTEFHFNTFRRKKNIISALDTLRHVSGITKTGAAFKYAMDELSIEHGMRGDEVPKIIFLLSDGRSHDYPQDAEYAKILRNMFPYGVLDIWAYGTGEYVAINSLLNVTLSKDKIVTNRDLHRLPEMFAEFKGVEICEEVPQCVPGSDKPLDLMFVVDASNSLGDNFKEQINFVRRVLSPITVHPDAVRVSLITYSGKPELQFDFKRFVSTDAVMNFLNNVDPMYGTTRTRRALDMAFKVFTDPSSGVRDETVPKIALILTDGHSQLSPKFHARRLTRLANVMTYAVAISEDSEVDYSELLAITDLVEERVFMRYNLATFEENFVQYIGFGCPGLEGFSSDDFVQGVRGSVSVLCRQDFIELTVRTQEPFSGWIYVKDHYDDTNCIARGQDTKSIKLVVLDGQCGLKSIAIKNSTDSGYLYNYTAMVQFHPEIVTRVDQGLDIYCFHPQHVPDHALQELKNNFAKPLMETKCSYDLKPYQSDCVALDARVGDTLFHHWECDNEGYGMLVHDCFVESDEKTLEIIDSDGCAIDPYILETPVYSRGGAFNYFIKARRDMSVWKFPTAGSLRFRCKISLCDMEGAKTCKYMMNPQCEEYYNDLTVKRNRKKRQVSHHTSIKDGFERTIDVESRRLNVLESESLKPEKTVKYCTQFNFP